MYTPKILLENFRQLKNDRQILDEQIYLLKYYLDGQYYGFGDNDQRIQNNTAKSISTMSSTLLKYYLWSNGTKSFKFVYDSNRVEIKDFADRITECIRSILDNNETYFNESLAKAIADWNDYGAAYLTLDEDDETLFRFSTLNVINTFIDLDFKQRPLFFYIEHNFTVTQILSKWKEESEKFSPKLKSLIDNNKMSSTVKFLHIILPRDSDISQFKNKINLSPRENINKSNFKGIWIELEQNDLMGNVISEEGFWEIPIYMARHNPRTGNKYGEGAGLDSLSDILLLQELQREFNHTRHVLIEPAMWIRDSSILGSNFLRTHPEAINEINPGLNGVNSSDIMGIVPNNSAQAIGVFNPSIDRAIQSIRQSYFLDRLAQLATTSNMTATEVLEIRANRVAFFSSHRSEIYNQLLSPILKRCFNIAWRKGVVQKYFDKKGWIIPYEFQLDKDSMLDFHLSFDTNATTDEKVQQSSNISGFNQQVGQMKSVFPEQAQEIDDQFDVAKIVRDAGEIYNLNQESFRSLEQIAELQQGRQQQKQQQALQQQQEQLINSNLSQQVGSLG